MLKLNLDDVNVEGLQKIAGYYGIPVAGVPRDQLATKIQERMAAGTEVRFGQGSKPWWKTPAVVVSVIAAAIAAAAMTAAWYSARIAAVNPTFRYRPERVFFELFCPL